MGCRIEYRGGVWVIYYNGKPIATVELDEEIYEELGDAMTPEEVDERVRVECLGVSEDEAADGSPG